MSRQPILALIDCNNFFVSCERLFRPDLEGKPVVVLSSNDGCAVSRSAEAKELGIPMGAPAFKYRDLFERHQVTSFSANFELYGNLSRRITALLTSITPKIEIYSVDESFLDLSQLPITDYEIWGKEVRQRILDWVGIPVSVGIAPSKTLAKLANMRAKKDPLLNGVLSLIERQPNGPVFNVDTAREHLGKTAAADIWGIGYRLAPKVRSYGMGSALDIADASPQFMQQLMGIHGRQLVAELNGTSCYPLELEGKLPKSISVTRTFGQDTTNEEVVQAALVSFATRGAFKLRRSNQLTTRITMFTSTSKYKPGYGSWAREVKLQQPTSDTETLIKLVTEMFQTIYHHGVSYHRAGITLHDFVPDQQIQTDLLGTVDVDHHESTTNRMKAIDAINNKFGSHKIRYAAEDLHLTWTPQRKIASPRYVSDWDELPVIKP